MNGTYYDWQSAFNITPQTDVSYPVASMVKSRELSGNVSVPPHKKPKATKSNENCNSVLGAIAPIILTSRCSEALDSFREGWNSF